MWKFIAPLVVAAGCVPATQPSWFTPATTGAAPAAEPPATEAGPSTTTAGLSCTEVVQCLAGCNASSDCFGACVDGADPGSRAAVDGLLQCNANGGGGCDAELAACRGDGDSSGSVAAAPGPIAPEQPGQPHSTADLLPWMTGSWIGSRHQFVFYGDGRVRRSAAGAMVEDHPGTVDDRQCAAVANELGTVRQEGDLLIMEFGDNSSNTCGIRETASAFTVRYRITWFDNAYDDDPYLQLILVDLDCTAGSMWCDDGMHRR